MKTKASPGLGSRCKVLLPWIFASLFIGSLSAGSVPVKVDSTNATAIISVPKNSGKLLFEFKDPKTGTWRTYKNLPIKLSPASVQVALPKGFQFKSWRATTSAATLPSAKAKYPQKFFNGKKVFSASVASSYAVNSKAPTPPSSTAVLKNDSTVVHALAMGAPSASATPVPGMNAAASTSKATGAISSDVAVEADIWKVDGTTAYFFNQHRGLQVIDLSDPANPTLKAYYRLPAKGQDLYILPAQGGVQSVVLITNENDGSTGVLLLKVDGTKVTALSSQNIPGWNADSRMVGNRLYLANQSWGWYWNSDCITTLNEVLVDPATGSLVAGNSFPISGAWPVISAGGEWLAVATSDWNDWQTSKVTLFSLRDSGALKTADAFPLFGRIYDKDHMGYESGRFSAVSERWVPNQQSQDSWWWNGTLVTELQNFSDDGSSLASLEIQRGETLYAAKFDGDKAYVVTALKVDPLFVVDLSDPTNPVLAGQLKVPGFSTRIVPLPGDKLFTIGFDGSNKVSASIFGVSDPSNPVQLSTVSLGGTWGYSAATYDDKALKVLPEAGLAFIPYTSYSDSWVSQQYVQVLKLDSNSGTLALGGTITNRFDPLRATVIGDTAVSISQKDLVTADLSNPESPKVLADLLLAWPVNRVLESGNYLLQISDGSSWYGGTPGLVVSTVSDENNVLGEASFGEGTVKDAVVFDKTLRLLRQNGSNLSLDIYGLDALPEVTFLGSTTATIPGNAWDLQVGKMLSPVSNCVVSVVQPNSRCWYGWAYPSIAIDPIPRVMRLMAEASIMPAVVSTPIMPPAATTESVPVTASCATYFKNWWCGYGVRSQPATALIYQVSTPSSPTALPSVTLTDTNAGAVNVSDAGGGLLVIGYADGETLNQWKRFRYRPLVVRNDGTGSTSGISTNQGDDYGLLSTAKHHFRILDLQDPSAPVLGPVQDLPGKLLTLSDLSRDGFLAWTETCGFSRQVQVSACNGSTLSQVASVNVDFGAPIAAANRNLFAAGANDHGSVISRWTLVDSGTLQPSGSLALTWMPSFLQATTAGSSVTLVGTDGGNLFSSLWNSGSPQNPSPSTWNATMGFNPSLITPIRGGGIAVPEGDYGAEIFRP